MRATTHRSLEFGGWMASAQFDDGVLTSGFGDTEQEALADLEWQVKARRDRRARHTYTYNYETNKFEKEDN